LTDSKLLLSINQDSPGRTRAMTRQ
jgi:hypothetical protein